MRVQKIATSEFIVNLLPLNISFVFVAGEVSDIGTAW